MHGGVTRVGVTPLFPGGAPRVNTEDKGGGLSHQLVVSTKIPAEAETLPYRGFNYEPLTKIPTL